MGKENHKGTASIPPAKREAPGLESIEVPSNETPSGARRTKLTVDWIQNFPVLANTARGPLIRRGPGGLTETSVPGYWIGMERTQGLEEREASLGPVLGETCPRFFVGSQSPMRERPARAPQLRER